MCYRAQACYVLCDRMYFQVIDAEQRSSKHWELTGEGCEIAEQGSHEARVFNAIPEEGMPQSQLMVSKHE